MCMLQAVALLCMSRRENQEAQSCMSQTCDFLHTNMVREVPCPAAENFLFLSFSLVEVGWLVPVDTRQEGRMELAGWLGSRGCSVGK